MGRPQLFLQWRCTKELQGLSIVPYLKVLRRVSIWIAAHGLLGFGFFLTNFKTSVSVTVTKLEIMPFLQKARLCVGWGSTSRRSSQFSMRKWCASVSATHLATAWDSPSSSCVFHYLSLPTFNTNAQVGFEPLFLWGIRHHHHGAGQLTLQQSQCTWIPAV